MESLICEKRRSCCDVSDSGPTKNRFLSWIYNLFVIFQYIIHVFDMIHLLGNVKDNGGFYISCGSISNFRQGSPVCFKVLLLFLLCHNLFWHVSTSFDFVFKNRLERWWLWWAVTPRPPPYPSLNTSGLKKIKKLYDDISYQGLL